MTIEEWIILNGQFDYHPIQLKNYVFISKFISLIILSLISPH